jgi:simple sugar transport system permease protein
LNSPESLGQSSVAASKQLGGPWSAILQSGRQSLRELVLVPVIVFAAVLGAVLVPNFLSFTNIVTNILVNSAVLGVVVIAESVILIGGNFDLSLQSTVGLAPMLAAWLATPQLYGGSGADINQFLALAVALAVGAVIGLANGVMIAKLRLNAFMVTLAMLILLQGFTLGVSGGQTISSLPSAFTYVDTTTIASVPLEVWMALIAFVLAAIFMRYHQAGRRIYAVGGNPDAARAAGINVARVTIGTFVTGSALAAIAGLMETAQIASVTANQGQNLIFTVFAAAVIGGISLNGGRGTIIGAGTGVLLLGMIQNMLVLSNVPSFWIDAIYGGIILGALGLTSVWEQTRTRARKARTPDAPGTSGDPPTRQSEPVAVETVSER